MEIISGILGFLQIVNLIISLKEKISHSKEETTSLGNLLIDIGNLLFSVSEDLEKNIYPHGKCSQIEVYAQQLECLVKGYLDPKQLDILHEHLQSSLQIEKLLGQLNCLSAEEKLENLNTLKTASGKFVAFGEILKIKK